MPRFFADKSQISNDFITLTDEDFRHIRSLRLKESESFIVCDGNGTDYICRLKGAGNKVFIDNSFPTNGEPKLICRIYAAYSKSDRMEYVVQKAVELGIHDIILFPSERCVVKYDRKSLEKKLPRWQKISLEAAKQCSRGIIPIVRAVDSYEAAIDEAAKADVPLYCYELEESLGLRDALSLSDEFNTVSIVTGPEGGFQPEETQYALTKGMRVITLGPRILRCETAPVAALAAIMYHTGNF